MDWILWMVLQCMEDAGCALPMLREMADSFSKLVPNEIDHHKDAENCGHDLIAHGDHFDCLVPLRDGSYVLSHAQKNEIGGSEFFEHGGLVKVGETLGKLKRRPKQLVDLFSYENPKRQGYESLPHGETSPRANYNEKKVKKTTDHHACKSKCTPVPNPIQAQCCSGKGEAHHHDTKVTIPKASEGMGLGKTTLDVMGICCPSEVPLIKKLLEPIPGVEEVSVNVTSKTVTVLHDQLSASATQLGECSYLFTHPLTLDTMTLLLLYRSCTVMQEA
jgi:copper chaperone CopZ